MKIKLMQITPLTPNFTYSPSIQFTIQTSRLLQNLQYISIYINQMIIFIRWNMTISASKLCIVIAMNFLFSSARKLHTSDEQVLYDGVVTSITHVLLSLERYIASTPFEFITRGGLWGWQTLYWSIHKHNKKWFSHS